MITECHEKGSGRTGSSEYSDGRLITKSTRVFEVQVDDQDHDDQYILQFAQSASPDPIPNTLDPHPTNTGIRCKSRVATQHDDEGVGAKYWRVTCEYDNSVSDDDADDAGTTPLERRVKFHIEFGSATKILERDNEGVPIVNTVLDPFDPPLDDEDDRFILVAKKNYAESDFVGLMQLMVDYRNSTNSDYWKGLPPGSWRFVTPQMSELQTEDDVKYYTVSWRFEAKDEYDIADPSTVEGSPEPWDRVVLNTGYNAFTTANDDTTKVTLLDKEPQKLKADGTLFEAGDDPNYYYRTFKTKKRRAFVAIGIGS